MSGTLFVVATPIGNLGDLSPRAAEVLRRVGAVAAEDTRETGRLTHHVGSAARLVSWHAHSSESRLDQILDLLRSGVDVALTTDAGTPGVSDPGPVLIRAAREAGFPVIPIPGPSAVATALMASGLLADRYLFLGFAPRKGTERAEWLDRIKSEPNSVVCFEAPGRVGQLVADLLERCGPERSAMVGREMTKKFEEYRSGTLAELAAWLAEHEPRGEVTLVIAGAGRVEPVVEPDPAVAIAKALIGAGLERSRVAKAVAEVYGLSRNESYRLVAEA